MIKEIKFNDLKTIGYSFKVSTNGDIDNYTVIDYNEDVKYPNYSVSGVEIVLSKNDNNIKRKKVIFYKYSFLKHAINDKFKLVARLLDDDFIKVIF